ncbi:unnamed protein product [Lota lota]
MHQFLHACLGPAPAIHRNTLQQAIGRIVAAGADLLFEGRLQSDRTPRMQSSSSSRWFLLLHGVEAGANRRWMKNNHHKPSTEWRPSRASRRLKH